MDILDFKTAMQKTGNGKKHLLLGNGFSRGFDDEIFNYFSLLKKIEGSFSAKIRNCFESLSTTDFERVIRNYESAATMCEIYGYNEQYVEFVKSANMVRQGLIEAITQLHPDKVWSVDPYQANKCADFISNFSQIYTLNYDLLLYWVLMLDMEKPESERILNGAKGKYKKEKYADGFSKGELGELVWNRRNPCTIRYLHGALHLFPRTYLHKLSYEKEGVPLKDQFTDLISGKDLPLFVTEGTSEKKLRKIQSSPYLMSCYNSLSSIGSPKGADSVFVFGASLSEADEHVVTALRKNKCKNIAISNFGNEVSPRIEVVSNMLKNYGKEVLIFDAVSADVWG